MVFGCVVGIMKERLRKRFGLLIIYVYIVVCKRDFLGLNL